MEQEVYVDLYFLINTGMDLLCLMITASLLHRKVHRGRAVLGAALGGAYAVLALLFGGGGIWGFLTDCALAFVMCTVAFYQKTASLSFLLKTTATDVLVSMLLGGIMTGLYSLLNRLHLPLDVLQGDGLSVWGFAILTLLASIATLRGGRFFGFSRRMKSVTVRATLFGHELTLEAFVDSGNLLRDPLSGKSVIVADREKIKHLLPLPLRTPEPPLESLLNDPRLAHRLRLIPTKTATGESMLVALIPDRLEISDGKNTYGADYLLAPAELGDVAKGLDAIIALE